MSRSALKPRPDASTGPLTAKARHLIGAIDAISKADMPASEADRALDRSQDRLLAFERTLPSPATSLDVLCARAELALFWWHDEPCADPNLLPALTDKLGDVRCVAQLIKAALEFRGRHPL